MRIVQKKQPAVEFLLGEAAVDTSAVYRRASFCVVTENGGKAIAYNALTKELAELDGGEAAALLSESVRYTEELCALVRSYYLVPADFDEEKLCDGIASFAKKAAQSDKITHFTVFTTTDCNARCFYCYEHGIKHTYMSAADARRAAEFIKEASHGEKVSLTWYGGEPLMNAEAIDIITGILSESDVAFTSQIATNGLLFDRALVEKAISAWHTDKVQITLDGTEEVYERIKAYPCGKGTFLRVLDNIDALLSGGVRVNIRINLDGHNIDDAGELVRVLAERFSGCAGLNVYTALLFDDCKGARRPSLLCDRLELAKRAVEIEDIAAESGILRPRRLHYSVTHSFCKADSDNALVILADGNFVKCDFYTDSRFVGNLWDGVDTERAAAERAAFSKRIECKGCSAYPICMRPTACPTGSCDAARRYIAEERLVRSVRFLHSDIMEKKDV